MRMTEFKRGNLTLGTPFLSGDADGDLWEMNIARWVDYPRLMWRWFHTKPWNRKTGSITFGPPSKALTVKLIMFRKDPQ